MKGNYTQEIVTTSSGYQRSAARRAREFEKYSPPNALASTGLRARTNDETATFEAAREEV